ATAEHLLVQAMLDAPVFGTRWRWNATRALAVLRFRGGRKVPTPLQRMEAEDLVAAVFPDQLACPENLVGDREIPDHPLVNQTIADCLLEAMDFPGLKRVLEGMEAGQFTLLARAGRATVLDRHLRVATGGVPMVQAAFPGGRGEPAVTPPERELATVWSREDAIRELVRGRLEVIGPATTADVAAALGLPQSD